MSRLFLLVVVVVLLWWWFSSRRATVRSDKASKKPPDELSGSNQMVSCAHCGVHLPQSDALESVEGVFYCGEEHRRLGPGPQEKP